MKTIPKLLMLLFVFLAVFAACSKTDSTTPALSTDARDKFVGNWLINGIYFIDIVKSSAADGVIQLYNFGDNGVILIASVNKDSFYIPRQQVYLGTSNYDYYEGGGSISDGNNITYEYTSWSHSKKYTATGYKK